MDPESLPRATNFDLQAETFAIPHLTSIRVQYQVWDIHEFTVNCYISFFFLFINVLKVTCMPNSPIAIIRRQYD